MGKVGDGERWGDRKEVSTKAVEVAAREQWRPSAAPSRRPAETSHGNRCWDVGAGALTPTRMLPQVCLLKTRAQVPVASLGLPRATGNQQVSACREVTELAWGRWTGRLVS